MAGELKVTCGQCNKVMQVPEVLAGKRIKCRGCSGTLMVPKPAPPKAATVVDEGKKGGMYEQAVAYGITKLDDQVRCAFCASDLDDGQVVCLKCGYNMQTRERHGVRVLHKHTGGDYFLWHLPSGLCVLAVLFCIFGIVVVWTDFLDLGEFFTENVQKWKWGAVYATAFLAWMIYLAGRFAIKRIFYHPHPPEVEKFEHEKDRVED
ncbi:MAG TPA: hypothetical protein PLN21_05300 [Gemmatales bacterium]|nr:hypothetical protein [Gemmatales bacterium]